MEHTAYTVIAITVVLQNKLSFKKICVVYSNDLCMYLFYKLCVFDNPS